MKIIKWEGNPHSAVNGIAHIQIEPNEIADIEKMLELVDGDSVGNFGFSVEIIGEEDMSGGFSNASTLKQKHRVYRCFVHRD